MNLLFFLLPLFFSPLLLSVINKTKARFAGRRGPRWLQPYWDLSKLLRKDAVYSRTTSFIFRLSPLACLAAVLTALLFLPTAGFQAPFSFEGDMIVLAAFLGFSRFFTVLAALDTGSSFEGMGASREIFFSSLGEPIFFLVLLALHRLGGTLSLSPALIHLNGAAWAQNGPALVLLSVSLFVILLTENSRIPVDDPNTHLELTMIHEVMVLDNSGPDLALVEYASCLKLWIFSSMLTGFLSPWKGTGIADLFSYGIILAAVAAGVGIVESLMARLKMSRVPFFICGAAVTAILAMTRIFWR